MAHLQYMPGDPRLVDQLVYELKSKGIFDQFRKECIADVDTRPAYQNLRQRVEGSVATFLSRQCWKPDLNKNQLREKLRKHVLDGNYLEQGVERIVDQVVNPKVASVFMPQVEDLVYNYLGITRKKTAVPATETSNGKLEDLLPTDLEAVSPGSVNNDDKDEAINFHKRHDIKMDVDNEVKDATIPDDNIKNAEQVQDIQLPTTIEITSNESECSIDKASIPLPTEEIRVENIPPPDNSPPKVELDDIQLPKDPDVSTDIPLPDEIQSSEKEQSFKPINVNSEEDDSSSDSSLRRNMSPLTPIRNFNNENSCDAQQAFENDLDIKSDDVKEPSSFRFAIESQSPVDTPEVVKPETETVKPETETVKPETETVKPETESVKLETEVVKPEVEQPDLSYQFNKAVNINTFNTPLYEDSSNSNNLQIDYESDANSKMNNETKVPEAENSSDFKKEKKPEVRRSSHKSSHRSRDSHRHSSSKDKRFDSKQSRSRDSSRHDKKPKDDHSKSKSSHKERERSKDRSEKKDSRDSSKHRSSHKSSSHRDSKSHRSSSSSQRHSSKQSDDKKSSNKDKDRSSESYKSSKDKSKESKSSSHRSDKDKDKKSSKSKGAEKDKKKDKKDTDDHYSLSGRGNPSRRSTDRDSNDGSSSSKGSNNPSNTKPSESKKESKGSSKSDNTSTSGESASPCDKEHVVENKTTNKTQQRPIVRVDTHLEMPIANPPKLPFLPDMTIKKPRFAANFKEAKRLMKMRKYLDEEQKRMNQEAALLLEFQANVRPSLSQVYSRIPGPELEFACVNPIEPVMENNNVTYEIDNEPPNIEGRKMTVEEIENIIGINVGSEMSNVVHVENFEENNEITNNLEAENECIVIPVVKDIQIDPELESEHNFEQLVAAKQPTTDDSNDNKTFSDLIDEITKYKNASENKTNVVKDEENIEVLEADFSDKVDEENIEQAVKEEIIDKIHENIFDTSQGIKTVVHVEEEENIERIQEEVNKIKEESKKRIEYFEITIITEELSETEDGVIIEPVSNLYKVVKEDFPDENLLEYFGENEKYDAELERDKFNTFLNKFIKTTSASKIHLINCDTYEENIMKEASGSFGHFEIVKYFKNGYSKLAKVKNIVKNVNVTQEIKLPLDSNGLETPKSPVISPVPSPVKSECSFELSSEYDAKLEEMVNKTSRQEVMEIILGGVIDESPSEMPKIDYCMESNIESEENTLKRKCEVESSMNNNRQVLTPNKIRKMSDSDQITSTTEETEELSNNNRVQNSLRSKYLGKARRVGLPRPRKTNIASSPSSDKSVENYEHNPPSSPQPHNGKLKVTPRIKIQRYDTTDLYKPKLHYLSRRNNIS